MSRSKWKGSYTDLEFIKQRNLENIPTLSIISRSSKIVPAFLGSTFNVYNGKSYMEVTVTNEMIGHKFGEFSYTRLRFAFKKKEKKR